MDSRDSGDIWDMGHCDFFVDGMESRFEGCCLVYGDDGRDSWDMGHLRFFCRCEVVDGLNAGCLI